MKTYEELLAHCTAVVNAIPSRTLIQEYESPHLSLVEELTYEVTERVTRNYMTIIASKPSLLANAVKEGDVGIRLSWLIECIIINRVLDEVEKLVAARKETAKEICDAVYERVEAKSGRLMLVDILSGCTDCQTRLFVTKLIIQAFQDVVDVSTADEDDFIAVQDEVLRRLKANGII